MSSSVDDDFGRTLGWMDSSYSVASLDLVQWALREWRTENYYIILGPRIYCEGAGDWTGTIPLNSQTQHSTWTGPFVPALGLRVSLVPLPCECLPTTGHSFLNSLIQAQEEASLTEFSSDYCSFWVETFTQGHFLCVVVIWSLKELPCHITPLIDGHPFAKNSLKLLPGTGDCG